MSTTWEFWKAQGALNLDVLYVINTEAINSRDITKTGIGPRLIPGESFVKNFHMPPVPVPVFLLRVANVIVVFVGLSVPPVEDIGATKALEGDPLGSPIDNAIVDTLI
ncbi:hypothetical protein WA026_006169 [Henosepilachna vigintioctopunctata]|uniref:Uncharacterized protein n=1 Tax=Henosepilachna vigintioctopunctata TaxID=420089 RepID=A0AAW1TSE7_9CUCU